VADVPFFDVIPAALFELEQRSGIVDWCEANRNLSARYSAVTGPWRRDTAPYAAEVMEAFQDPTVRDITLPWASQTTKTTTLENIMLFSMATSGVPAIWVLPESKTRNAFVQERLRPTIEASPKIKAALSPKKRAITNAKIDFLAAPLYMALSDSEADLSGKSCGIAILDEADKFPETTQKEASPLDQAMARLRTYHGKLLVSSTVTTPSGLTWKRWLESDMSRWCVADPQTGERHPWQWKWVKWEERPDNLSRREWAEQIRAGKVAVWYEFPSGARISTKAEKDALNRAGVWVPTHPERRTHRGFHLPSMASMWTTFRELAAQYLEAVHEMETTGDERKLQHFVIHELAEPYMRRAASAGEALLLSRVSNVPRGIVPPGTTHVILSEDVQDDRVPWMALAFNATDRSLHIVDHGDARDTLIAATRFLEAKRWTGQGFDRPATLVLIDSGDGDRTEEVYRVCRSFKPRGRRPHVIPIKGASAKGQFGGGFFKFNEKDDSEHGGRLCLIDTDAVKNLIYQKLRNGSLTLFQGAQNDRELLAQLMAERRTMTPRGLRWECPPGHANHKWDTLVYGTVGALILGLIRRASPQAPELATGEIPSGMPVADARPARPVIRQAY
jgi:phage terminase large subunit GpA-like protein